MTTTQPTDGATAIYSIGKDAGGKTWSVSDQYCVLFAGCTTQQDAERVQGLLAMLHDARKAYAAQANERAALLECKEALQDLIAYEDDRPAQGTRGFEIYTKAEQALAALREARKQTNKQTKGT